MKLETILLSLLIVMSMRVITEQQAKGDNSSAGSKDLQQKPDRMTGALDKFEKCSSAQNETLCKMNVMGLSDEDAISILGLNESKVKK